MPRTTLIVSLLLFSCAAIAAEIETTTTENGVKTRWSVTSISEDKVMRIDEGGWGTSATMSSDEAAGSGAASVQYEKGPTRDTMIYNPRLGAIMSVEGRICRVLSEKSAAPPGMDFMNSSEMKNHQRQMADAMSGANKQIADAMAQMKQGGASQTEIDAMNQVMKGFNMAGPETDDSLHVEALEKDVSVGEFQADVYIAKTASGVEKYRFYMTDIDDVPGGRAVKDGMVGMMNTYADYMSGIGAGQLMDEAVVKIMNGPEFKNDYPVAIDDLQSRTHTEVSRASNRRADVDFSPECEKKDMMEY